jgi:DNA-binding CsgD family transcriptional regulator
VDFKLIGREDEIAEICGFFSTPPRTPKALVISGDVGIGKTMVWKHVAQEASQSARVLSCRPASAERPLAFSALVDLFGEVADEILSAVAGPRRRALETALLHDRAEAVRTRPERQVVARGVLDALRILSAAAPLVIAVDDAQWLDRPSASVLEFCFRRLEIESVSILVTLRADSGAGPLGLDRVPMPVRLGRVRLGPLTLGAIGEILRSRLGVVLPRYALTRLYEACGGNPFYALECARTLAGRPRMSSSQEPMPVPPRLGELVQHHVSQLTPGVRWAGGLVAASSDPRERLIRAACDDGESWAAIDEAVDAGLLERDGEMLRFTHPLLRSVLYGEMGLTERKHVHRRLAVAAEDTEERAWHLALGADRPSELIAVILDEAARHASGRGAPEAAAALEEQATRLTPSGRPDSVRDRTVHAADYYFRSGDITRSRELIQSALASCPDEACRAPLLLRLATIYYRQNGWAEAEQTFRAAARAAPDDPVLCAHAEQELAFARLVAGDLPAASRWAEASLRSARRADDPRIVAHSLARVALFEFLRGRGARLDLLERAEALGASAGEEPVGRLPMLDPSLVTGVVLKWCDRLDEARAKLADRYRQALDSGDEASIPFLLYHFSQLECWAGNWAAAEEYAAEGDRVADESHQKPMRPATLYSLALVRAHRGHVQQARELAGEALALCEGTGNVPLVPMLSSVLGFIALSVEDYQAVHAHLGHLADVSATVGLGEPSVLKFLPDEIEALAILGQTELAWALTRKLEAQGELLGRPWAQAAGARCRAHLASLDGDLDGGLAACDEALGYHERLAMPFELGRTLLVKGMIQRRARHKALASESLGQALATFERLGAPLWAGKARRELARITNRASERGLTAAEHRIADLIAQGQTNRQVASTLFVTENTVQTHVRHIFQKLQVRSRTELAAYLLSAPDGSNGRVLR